MEAAMARRVRAHLLAQLACLGRHTITGLLTTCGQTDRDWSADYRLYSRRKLDLHQLFDPVRQSLCQGGDGSAPIVVALDDTRLHKSGRHIPGARYTRDPLGPPFHTNFIRAQRFLQISLAAVHDHDPLQARMVPIDLVHAPSAGKAPRGATAEQIKEHRQKQKQQALGEVAVQRLAGLRQALDEDGHAERILWSVVDGGYTNATVLKKLPPRTRLTGRIRKDAKLFFAPVDQPATGRPRIYGEQAPTPEQLRSDPDTPWEHVQAFACGKEHTFKVKSLGPLFWKKTGAAMPLRLIVIAPLAYRLRKGDKLLYRQPAFLICTDPEADLQQIVQTYIYRWDIETNFRDQKTLLGLGQAQVRHEKSVEAVPVLACAAYAMLLCAACRGSFKNNTFAPKWRHTQPSRPSTASLINRLRYELWADRIRFDDFVQQPHDNTKPAKLRPSLCSSLFRAAS
jgi:hypothetical protein